MSWNIWYCLASYDVNWEAIYLTWTHHIHQVPNGASFLTNRLTKNMTSRSAFCFCLCKVAYNFFRFHKNLIREASISAYSEMLIAPFAINIDVMALNSSGSGCFPGFYSEYGEFVNSNKITKDVGTENSCYSISVRNNLRRGSQLHGFNAGRGEEPREAE